ncbi:diphthamide synthesis protein [Nanoarchaeota archaeon]
MEYDLELEKAVNKIKEEKAKTVCIQLAEGLKPKAKEIKEYIEKNTDSKVVIWADSAFGGCDLPDPEEEVDLLIHFGHSEFSK